jgi:hypothetical protein
VAMRQAFAKFRVGFWVFSAGIICLYLYGLFFQAYSPLELGVISVICLTLLGLFAVHEVLLRRELQKHPREADHTDKERRGF